MVVRTPDNLCVVCGSIIPEGRMICPMCGTKDDAESFAKLIRKDTTKREVEFKVDDKYEQAFRQGYKTGFKEGMKHVCELKQDYERLKRENALLKSQIETRMRIDDEDGVFE